MTILAARYRPDGSAVVMLDADVTCSVCRKATQWVTIKRDARGGSTMTCWGCD